MKVYISADIEGIAGIAHWDEANRDHPAYPEFRRRMTAHVRAACLGANDAGASEIWVKDAHASARNIEADELPDNVRLIRGWSEHPLMMVQELDRSFDAVCFVGYHSMAGSGANPLAHTLSSSKVMRMSVNGVDVSEYHLYAWAASDLGVPPVFLTGDQTICDVARALNPAVTTVPALYGVGESTVSRAPKVVWEEIRQGMRAALRGDLSACMLSVDGPFELVVEYHRAGRAYRGSHYPGAERLDDHRVRLRVDAYHDVLRALVFIL